MSEQGGAAGSGRLGVRTGTGRRLSRQEHALPVRAAARGDPPQGSPAGGSMRELVDLVVRAVDAAADEESSAGSSAWEQIRRAQESRAPITGRVLITVGAGAFLYLGPDLYGFAPRSELPAWVPSRPDRDYVGRELKGAVMDIDEGSRSVVLSPRLLALRKAWRCVRKPRRMSGRILSSDLDGVVVDLGGAKAFAPRSELDLEWLVAGAEPGLRVRGYVIAVGDALVSLSLYGPRRRVKRARRRATALAAMTERLHDQVDRAVVSGLVLATGEDGAVVALEGGLIAGFVPGLALDSRPRIAAGSTLEFRVIGRPEEPDRDIDVLLWPEPLDA